MLAYCILAVMMQ